MVKSSKKKLKFQNPLNSVGGKLFLYIFGGILICVVTIGIISYNEAKTVVENEVQDASEQTIQLLSANVNNVIEAFNDISTQIMIDNELHQSIRTITSSSEKYEVFMATQQIGTSLQSYILSNLHIFGVVLLPIDEKNPVITAGSSESNVSKDLVNEPWFQKAIDMNGQKVWVDSRNNGITTRLGTPTFAIARALKDTISGKANYVVVLDVNLKAITDNLYNVDLGEDSNISIIDEDGKYIVNDDQTVIGQASPYQIAESDNNSTHALVNGKEVLFIQSRLNDTNWFVTAEIPVDELVKEVGSIRNITIIISAIAAIIAIIIAIIVVLTIGNPLVNLKNLMLQGSKGDLTVRSSVTKRKDEIGELSRSFNLMMSQITDLAVRTTESAKSVLETTSSLTDASAKTAQSAKEIAVATEEIAKGSTSLATEAERGNDLSLNINEQMVNVMNANKEMVNSAYQVEEVSGKGTAYMAELIEKTGMTEKMTRVMVEKVDTLQDSTQSIVKILDLLNNITKQTNILSLNATIEAARAGEAGKGFMVVANEIRNLADQSRQSIEVVGQIINKIQSEMNETTEVLQRANPIFQEQVISVKEANSIFITVQSEMGQFVNKLQQVTQSIHQLETSQVVLNEAMNNVSAVAEQSSATSQEVASLSSEQLNISDHLVLLSEQLNTVSKSLQKSITQFKVK